MQYAAILIKRVANGYYVSALTELDKPPTREIIATTRTELIQYLSEMIEDEVSSLTEEKPE